MRKKRLEGELDAAYAELHEALGVADAALARLRTTEEALADSDALLIDLAHTILAHEETTIAAIDRFNGFNGDEPQEEPYDDGLCSDCADA